MLVCWCTYFTCNAASWSGDRVQSADEQLGTLQDAGETTLNPDLGSKLVNDLKRMAGELDACKDCLEEGMIRVDKAMGKPGNTVSTQLLFYYDEEEEDNNNSNDNNSSSNNNNNLTEILDTISP